MHFADDQDYKSNMMTNMMMNVMTNMLMNVIEKKYGKYDDIYIGEVLRNV